jgi:hypothetical protein
VIGVIIIAVVFTSLAGGIWWAASRGGLGGMTKAMETQSRAGRRAVNLGLVVVYVGFGVVVPAIFIVGNHDRASAQVGGVKLNAAAKQGRTLFGEHCAVCHTLSAASAVGKTGPNLDQLAPLPMSLVLHTIENGCLQNPGNQANENCLGYGNMPAAVVQGRDAQDVAEFVSRAAGH